MSGTPGTHGTKFHSTSTAEVTTFYGTIWKRDIINDTKLLTVKSFHLLHAYNLMAMRLTTNLWSQFLLESLTFSLGRNSPSLESIITITVVCQHWQISCQHGGRQTYQYVSSYHYHSHQIHHYQHTHYQHVSIVSESCFYWLHQLRRSRRSLDAESAATLVHAFVASHIDYCNAVLACAPKVTTDKLQRVLNAAARVVTGTKKCNRASRPDSTTPRIVLRYQRADLTYTRDNRT